MSRGMGVGGYVWGLDIPPPKLMIPSGGHHTYSHQAAGMHPTGMLSCSHCESVNESRNIP